MNQTVYSGVTSTTVKEIVLDAGAFFKNFVYGTDTYASALAAGKCIGATQGGGTFKAVPTMRQIPVDGIKGKMKGLEVVQAWDVNMAANLLQINADTIALALGMSTETVDAFYEKIVGKNYVLDTDYFTNITYVGKDLGTSKPIVIVVQNALNTTGLNLTFADNAEAVMAVDFAGHYTSSTPDTPPFEIYNPKAEGSISGTVTDGGTPDVGATVVATVGTETFTTTTTTGGVYQIDYLPYGSVAVVATHGAKTGSDSGTVVAGTTTALGAIAIV